MTPPCNKCKRFGNCDGIPTDDCLERAPDTERCPPPSHIEIDGDSTVIDAYRQIQKTLPHHPVFGRRIVLSGKFETLERVRAMRGAS